MRLVRHGEVSFGSFWKPPKTCDVSPLIVHCIPAFLSICLLCLLFLTLLDFFPDFSTCLLWVQVSLVISGRGDFYLPSMFPHVHTHTPHPTGFRHMYWQPVTACHQPSLHRANCLSLGLVSDSEQKSCFIIHSLCKALVKSCHFLKLNFLWNLGVFKFCLWLRSWCVC